jgi:hypothetical protein
VREEVYVIEKPSNLERLKEKGVYDAKRITPEEEKLVASMTGEEVDVLIRLHEKLGGTAPGRTEIRPNFPL